MPEIIIKRRKLESPSQPLAPIYNKRYGQWGKVERLHAEDNTVDLTLDSGIPLNRVPVASNEWVVSGADTEKEYNSGERNLPPVHARIFVMMPTGTYDDCFVVPFSGFSTIDQTQPFMEEGLEQIRERITPGGWHITGDYSTGSHKSVSPDGKTSLEIDYGTEEEPKADAPELHLSLFDEIKADILADESVTVEVFDEVKITHKKDESVTVSVFDELEIEHVKGDFCTIKVFDTEIVLKKGEVSIKPKETTIEVEGNATIKTSGDTTVEASGDTTVKGTNITAEASGDATVKGTNVTAEASVSATIKAPQVQITGGQLTVNGTAAPGSGPFCGIPACLFTGAPHSGNMVSGT